MSANNSKSRKAVRRAVALKNFSYNPEKAASDKDYTARKDLEKAALNR